MVTQEKALKIANDLFKEKSPHAVIYGYHVKRGINAKEEHEYLDRPIVCKTKEDLQVITKRFLSQEHVTRNLPSRITGFDILYHAVDESIKTKSIKIK